MCTWAAPWLYLHTDKWMHKGENSDNPCAAPLGRVSKVLPDQKVVEIFCSSGHRHCVLLSHCQKSYEGGDLFVPNDGDIVDCSLKKQPYQILASFPKA